MAIYDRLNSETAPEDGKLSAWGLANDFSLGIDGVFGTPAQALAHVVSTHNLDAGEAAEAQSWLQDWRARVQGAGNKRAEKTLIFDDIWHAVLAAERGVIDATQFDNLMASGRSES